MNTYKVYFCSPGTGPMWTEVQARNSAEVIAIINARYPGAYNIQLFQK
jgi:hypothetical protein